MTEQELVQLEEALRNYQRYAKVFSIKNNFDKCGLDERLMFLATEYGEINKAIIKFQSGSENDKPALRNHIGEEMQDFIYNLADIANRFDIDMASCFISKMKSDWDRSWPSY